MTDFRPAASSHRKRSTTARTAFFLWRTYSVNLAKITLKSIYEGDKIEAGKKNMVYSLTYQAMDRTLTDDEVNKAHNKLRDKIVANGDIVLR